MTVPIYQVDAFANNLFEGNPAAVCIFDKWPADEVMQNIAAENNLSETSFLVKNQEVYDIRWFTPTVEVDLCGHATLASGFVVFNFLDFPGDLVSFSSLNSGKLYVRKDQDKYMLDFPADDILISETPDAICQALNISDASAVLRGKSDIMVVMESENDIHSVHPDMIKLNEINARGVIVTAPGDEVDFVSRFFGPRVGVPEDHVTGSAHTTLIPYWSKRLNKNSLVAHQLSRRGGTLYCGVHEDRVTIGGRAVLYLKGEINMNSPS